MDQIPIKHLVTQAQGLQQELGGEATPPTPPPASHPLTQFDSLQRPLPLLAAWLLCWNAAKWGLAVDRVSADKD